jgi:hypothetical protein
MRGYRYFVAHSVLFYYSVSSAEIRIAAILPGRMRLAWMFGPARLTQLSLPAPAQPIDRLSLPRSQTSPQLRIASSG